jgi:hypothetical protein
MLNSKLQIIGEKMLKTLKRLKKRYRRVIISYMMSTSLTSYILYIQISFGFSNINGVEPSKEIKIKIDWDG